MKKTLYALLIASVSLAVVAALVLIGGEYLAFCREQQQLKQDLADRSAEIRAHKEEIEQLKAREVADRLLVAAIQKQHAESEAAFRKEAESLAQATDARFQWQALVNADVAAAWNVSAEWKKKIEERLGMQEYFSRTRIYPAPGAPVGGFR